MINKYREDPTRRLTFTELRKMLIGDVCLIHKVYDFLDSWGLINFQSSDQSKEECEEAQFSLVVEEGIPLGIRVILNPAKSSSSSSTGEKGDDKFKFPPLTSYVDVFDSSKTSKENGGAERHSPSERVCVNCLQECGSSHYFSEKEEILICANCFKSGNYGQGRSADDFSLKDCANNTSNDVSESWSDAEVLLLLEGALKYGDDWDLVAGHVKTKSKHDCILKLIQLPSVDHMVSNPNSRANHRNNDTKGAVATSFEVTKIEDQDDEHSAGTTVPLESVEGHSVKRRCLSPLADAGTSLITQVASLSTMVSPSVAVAAAEAAVSALCNESPSARMLLGTDMEERAHGYGAAVLLEFERAKAVETCKIGKRDEQLGKPPVSIDEKIGTSMLRMRAAVATALGAAAANAKLLADQEDREIEHLVSSIIEAQVRKIECKIKHFEELEQIMDNEYVYTQNVKDSVLSVHLDILQRNLNAGILRGSNQTYVKPFVGLPEMSWT
ncbi:SWI/SNF complex subunit SWI3A isoform X2 [Nymphaea colorata]|nr:SWI/SNF complex subunit SWI3A isoform X2 [Nymphaea colorata]XP_031489973.1 SWI/SNF complex subunit SWI3A isoform X2 [Nymphaea colorata]